MRTEGQAKVEKRVVISTRCDGCGKQVNGRPEEWRHFSSSHNDWGNDSIDSWDYHDACSFPCYVKIVREVFDDYGVQREPTLSVDEMNWDYIWTMLAHFDGLLVEP